MSDAPGFTDHTNDGAAWLHRLRGERERQGLSREQLAENLHVDVQTIAALEAGRFSSLGAPVFARGHLRKYAALLGLDVEEMVSAFERESGQPPELVPLTSAPRLRPELPVKWLGAATVAAMVLGVAWWALTERDTSTTGRAQGAPREPAPVTPAAVDVVPEPLGVVSEPVAAAAEPPAVVESAAEVSVQGTPMRVRLNFSADSWVELYDAGGQRVFFDLGSANSVRSFTTAAPLRVFLGYADGVQLELNGVPVALPAEVRHGNLARFTVDARGQVQPAEG